MGVPAVTSVPPARLSLQRLVGKLTLLVALIYVSILVTGAVLAVLGDPPRLSEWLLLAPPAVLLSPAVVDAVNLHRFSDSRRLSGLWLRCGLLGLGALVLMILAAVFLNMAQHAR